eukprot:gb/GECG01008344.1/.p1 GENE.gb/GECG01008344.1/~~gb/GECG01008344.1/.p1  ORF type:complete len:340 (+),score=48.11 gb/GECG01008344.1/:1-1020(+)
MSAHKPSEAAVRAFNTHKWELTQIMLRIKDPAKTVPFYQNNFGMTLVHKLDMPSANFSLYFLATLDEEEKKNWPEAGTDESRTAMKAWDGCVLELTHNHGTENDPDFQYHNGNTEPKGFGHIGFLTDDVYKSCEALEAAGVEFQKKPDDGKMKGLAFAKDPDGYWVEIIKREQSPYQPSPRTGWSLQQGMIRIKDPKVSVPFYEKHFAMTLICERHFPEMGFSLYFLSREPEGKELPDPKSDEGWKYCMSIRGTALELTHNHGSENDDSFTVNNGNVEPHRGFGHFGFYCNDVYAASEQLEKEGVAFQKRPDEGRMKGLAFAKDPDGYWLELIRRDPPK